MTALGLGRRYDAEIEAGLDEAYQSFLERHRKREGAQAAKRARLGLPMETQSGDEDDSGDEEDASFQEVSDNEVSFLHCKATTYTNPVSEMKHCC